jgi:hypothetical protein
VFGISIVWAPDAAIPAATGVAASLLVVVDSVRKGYYRIFK